MPKQPQINTEDGGIIIRRVSLPLKVEPGQEGPDTRVLGNDIRSGRTTNPKIYSGKGSLYERNIGESSSSRLLSTGNRHLHHPQLSKVEGTSTSVNIPFDGAHGSDATASPDSTEPVQYSSSNYLGYRIIAKSALASEQPKAHKLRAALSGPQPNTGPILPHKMDTLIGPEVNLGLKENVGVDAFGSNQAGVDSIRKLLIGESESGLQDKDAICKNEQSENTRSNYKASTPVRNSGIKQKSSQDSGGVNPNKREQDITDNEKNILQVAKDLPEYDNTITKDEKKPIITLSKARSIPSLEFNADNTIPPSTPKRRRTGASNSTPTRKSPRSPIRPLEYWRGERMIYGRSASSESQRPIYVPPIKEIVRIPKEPVTPLSGRRSSKSKTRNGRKESGRPGDR